MRILRQQSASPWSSNRAAKAREVRCSARWSATGAREAAPGRHARVEGRVDDQAAGHQRNRRVPGRHGL